MNTVKLEELGGVRYLVDDLDVAVSFYAGQLGFRLRTDARPAFAELERGSLRLLLSGPQHGSTPHARRQHTSAGRLEPHPPSSSRTWSPRSAGCERQASASATTSSAVRKADRS